MGKLFPKSIFKTYTQNNSTTGHHSDYIGGKGNDIFSVVLDISFRPISIKVLKYSRLESAALFDINQHRSIKKHICHLNSKQYSFFVTYSFKMKKYQLTGMFKGNNSCRGITSSSYFTKQFSSLKEQLKEIVIITIIIYYIKSYKPPYVFSSMLVNTSAMHVSKARAYSFVASYADANPFFRRYKAILNFLFIDLRPHNH